MSACDVAVQYVDCIQSGRYDDLGELWAEDALFHAPHGKVFKGRKAIGAFYSEFLRKITPIIQGVRYVCDEKQRVCVMELESRMRRNKEGQWVTDPEAPWTLSAIDRFTVNEEGKIQHMIAYTAPDNRWLGD